jgi:DNA replication and repair protein RecF
MRLIRLYFQHIRNLETTDWAPHPQFNLLWGKNGSGKTSLLEGIHFLGVGRTFRSRSLPSVIRYGEAALSCFGQAEDWRESKVSLGVEKTQQGKGRLKVDGVTCETLADFARVLPLQVITPETFKLLLAGPEARRRFMDWGVFHVEPSFGGLCQRYQRLLKQRNAALKQREGETRLWDAEFARVGMALHLKRQRYVEGLKPFLEGLLDAFLPTVEVAVAYYPGWVLERGLEEALLTHARQDRRLGFTGVGPHRAEISFEVSGFPASLVLSRGQQKLLILALLIAQVAHLEVSTSKRAVYLMDDFVSELDEESRFRVIAQLAKASNQVFLTGVYPAGWEAIGAVGAGKRFHVEHGVLTSEMTT